MRHKPNQVGAVQMCMRYRLLERMPLLVNSLRALYEVSSICADALYQVILFR